MNVNVCPSTLAQGFTTYSPIAVRRLFDGLRISYELTFGIDSFRNSPDLQNAMHRISISGVQEKFPAVAEKGKIRLSAEGDRSKYILKPAPWDETIETRKQIPANEHLTMQIARQVYGIPTAENGLCFSPKGEAIYITKRFDITIDGEKCEMEDFASLLGRTRAGGGVNYKYDGSYEDIANAIKRYMPAWMVSMEQFFKLVVFNYIYGNGDAHLKNFSIIRTDVGYALAPAYDLLNTSIHIDGDDFGLQGGLSLTMPRSDVYEKTGHPCRSDFERFGELIGLRPVRIAKIMDVFSAVPDTTKILIANSFLTDKMKRSYLRIVETRTQRYNRK
jgi:serine/threonine-protein kinase HipA